MSTLGLTGIRIPDGWQVVPAGYLFRREKRVGWPQEQLLSVYRDHGIVPKDSRDDNFNKASEDLSSYQLVEPNDLVINKMKAWQGSVGISAYRGIVSPAYFVASPTRGFFRRYVHYLLRCSDYLVEYQTRSAGIRVNQWDLDWDDFRAIPIALPPAEDQERIANFLDEQTARIDALIAEKMVLVERLSELRYSTVSWAVAGGLHAARGTIKTDNPFVPELPTGWTLGGLTKYIGPVVDYRGKTPEKVAEGILLVTARNIRDGELDYDASSEYVRPEDYEEIMRRGRPSIGDVVFTTEAPLGQVANVDREDIALAQRVVKFRASPGILDNYFLKYWLMGDAAQATLETLATGSTAEGIKASKLGQIPLAVPPLAEQLEIVRFLDTRRQAIDAAKDHVREHIERLREYRSSLISAAVTGQLDISGLKPSASSNKADQELVT